MPIIYKICPETLWREAERDRIFRGAPVDLRDGFIHFSTAAQLAETARKHFAGESGLLLIAVNSDSLGPALAWEPSRGRSELFPHLYGELPLTAVEHVAPLPLGADGLHVLPDSPGMIGLFDRVARPLMRVLDPEDAHALTVKALRYAPLARPAADDPKLAVRAFGLNFPNPLGLAAGFDKNAEAPDALMRLGFGFVEIGTVTPRPQPGNPRPRLFRLDADEAVINRFGFNSEGAGAVLHRLAARVGQGGIVGVNVGANRDSADRASDYVELIETFAPVASYFTLNVSSPNTPQLRELQKLDVLDGLLARVVETRDRVSRSAGPAPVLLKIAPDVSLPELDDIVGAARRRCIDGMIVGNTTTARPPDLRERVTAIETGGLSGRPLFALSTRVLAETYVRVEDAFPLIGVGGINSGAAAIAKIKAGASLLQLYSGLVFRGVGLVAQIKADLLAVLRRGPAHELADLVGADAAAMTAERWPG